MNTPDRHQDDLSSEQAVNERYLRRAQEWRDQGQRLGSEAVPAPRSAKWVDEAPKMPITPTPRRLIAPLLGRVALSESDEELGGGFYVGSCYTPLEAGVTVVNWTAGAASLFFEGRAAAVRNPEDLHPRTVVARRSFVAGGECLVDFEDDIESDAPAASVFASAPRLEVPEPPPATPQRPVVSAPSSPSRPRSEAERSAAPAAGRQCLSSGAGAQIIRRPTSQARRGSLQPLLPPMTAKTDLRLARRLSNRCPLFLDHPRSSRVPQIRRILRYHRI